MLVRVRHRRYQTTVLRHCRPGVAADQQHRPVAAQHMLLALGCVRLRSVGRVQPVFHRPVRSDPDRPDPTQEQPDERHLQFLSVPDVSVSLEYRVLFALFLLHLFLGCHQLPVDRLLEKIEV